jgi:hypothetical protein
MDRTNNKIKKVGNEFNNVVTIINVAFVTFRKLVGKVNICRQCTCIMHIVNKRLRVSVLLFSVMGHLA